MKLASSFEGPVNFLLGGQYIDAKPRGSYTAANNEIDAILFQVGLYTGMDYFATKGESESYSLFGEIYWEPTERTKITGGLRYAHDKLRSDAVSTLGQSFRLPDDLGNPPGWIRQAFQGWLFSGNPDPTAIALTDFYGVTERALSAADTAELIGILQTVPPVPTFGEGEGAFDVPRGLSTDDVTGRLGIDLQLSDGIMLYAFYSRGRTPGGFTLDQRGQAAGQFDDENVNAFEVGGKTLLLDGSLLLNFAAFYYALDDLHVSARPPGALVEILNMDADAWGVELEARWRPTSSLDVEFAYGWLDTSIDDFQSLDILNLPQGDPNLIVLDDTSLRPGSTAGNFVAATADVLEIKDQAIADGAAVPAPGTVYPDGIPAWFSRAYLEANGVATADGVPADLDGNQLPAAPRHSIRLGLAYTWFGRMGSLTARWGYYWQDKSYARIFNRPGDTIDSWSQHNASLAFTTANGGWTIKAWIRNIGDEDNVTDHYLHANEGAGPYRNYFLTEPRIYGATLRFSFGSI